MEQGSVQVQAPLTAWAAGLANSPSTLAYQFQAMA
jgi:hypothetical protein